MRFSLFTEFICDTSKEMVSDRIVENTEWKYCTTPMGNNLYFKKDDDYIKVNLDGVTYDLRAHGDEAIYHEGPYTIRCYILAIGESSNTDNS